MRRRGSSQGFDSPLLRPPEDRQLRGAIDCSGGERTGDQAQHRRRRLGEPSDIADVIERYGDLGVSHFAFDVVLEPTRSH